MELGLIEILGINGYVQFDLIGLVFSVARVWLSSISLYHWFVCLSKQRLIYVIACGLVIQDKSDSIVKQSLEREYYSFGKVFHCN